MRPTVANVRPIGNPLLTRMLVSYMNDDSAYIARQCAPVVPVEEESGTYITFPTKWWFSDKLQRRPYGDTFARSGFGTGTDTYKTIQWGLEKSVPDELEATSQIPMQLTQVALRWLANQSNIRKEIAFATDFFASSTWGTDGTPTDWDDASGVPVTDSGTARRTIRQATGANANAIAMGEIVYDALKVNAQIAGRAQYTRTLTINEIESILAAVLGFEYLFVGRAVKNTANDGQTASLSPIIDDDALVFVLQPGADMFSVSSMKTFAWGAGGGEGTAKTYYDDGSNSTIAQHQEQWDQKLVAAATGYFFPDIV